MAYPAYKSSLPNTRTAIEEIAFTRACLMLGTNEALLSEEAQDAEWQGFLMEAGQIAAALASAGFQITREAPPPRPVYFSGRYPNLHVVS
ncbi:hypothetical protein [Microvirga lotononidis]|uniref:Uncharacterized protein n=1 Tax=Microvirga lotononidis TaxID=864069 RepID=I4Z354_9HYPH|nr:hypothetical protein [Microvirga lotononidis]EIM30646.1 hypothetical protein MicloDRAFT_00005490 [Microvirga lotononidis]WQO30382.1 hypothetical protein U0023_29430 [Microvirga lotononidis]